VLIISANGLPTTGERQEGGIFFNNGGLDDRERSVKRGETIASPSISGGTSIY
jgi:hypothetical protein